MSLLTLAVTAGLVFLLTLGGTGLVRRHALLLGLVAVPNERSSHTTPTPSGGGIAAAVSTLSVLFVVVSRSESPMQLSLVVTAALALLGLADDRLNLSSLLRLLLQAASLICLVAWGGVLPALQLGTVAFSGAALVVVLLFAALWWINLFNFMDGIDGLAASQTILIALLLLALGKAGGTASLPQSTELALVCTAAAAAGFLCWNWPRARIFMGDAGSYFFAAMLLACGLAAIRTGALSYFSFCTLVSVMVTDASTTLVRRIVHGEAPWRAHRSHAYQRLSRQWGHRTVVLAYLAVTLLWAAPFAWACHLFPTWEWAFLLVCYGLLLALAVKAEAGVREPMTARK